MMIIGAFDLHIVDKTYSPQYIQYTYVEYYICTVYVYIQLFGIVCPNYFFE
jgi:hypothetical protein